MDVELWSPKKHLAAVVDWAAERGLAIDPRTFPRTGLVVGGCAVSWLYMTDSGVMLMDGLLTRKSAPKEERQRALQILAVEMVRLARECGAVRLVCTTPLPHVAEALEATGPGEVVRGTTYFSWKGA